MKKNNIFKIFTAALVLICLTVSLLIPASAAFPHEDEFIEMYTPVTNIRGWVYGSYTTYTYDNTPEDNFLHVTGEVQGGHYPDFKTTVYVEIDNRDFLPSDNDNVVLYNSRSSDDVQSRVVSTGVSMSFSDFGDYNERPQCLVEGLTESQTDSSDYWYIGRFMYYNIDLEEWQYN